MLGGLLSRQEAEEEERQIREQSEQQQRRHHHQQAAPAMAALGASAEAAAVADSVTSSVPIAIESSPGRYGSLGGGVVAPAIVVRTGTSNDEVIASQRYLRAGFDDGGGGGEDHSDLEGEFSFDDDGDSARETDEEGASDDGSSAEGHEGTYLLRHPGTGEWERRRTDRRRQRSLVDDWKRMARRLGSKIRAVAVAIADVDNVWDSPAAAGHPDRRATGARATDPDAERVDGGGPDRPARSSVIYSVVAGGTTSTRNRTAAIFWFIFLSTSYASERSTFKLLVDRVVPFRTFFSELILGVHAILTLGGGLWGRLSKDKTKREFDAFEGGRFWMGLPLADVGLMAVLDTVYLLLGIISGAHVPPVLTVILVQTTIPLTACFTQCVHPDGACARNRLSSEGGEESSPGGGSSAALSPAQSHSNVQIISGSTLNEIQSMNEGLSFPNEVSSIPNLPAPAPSPVKGWGGLSRHHILGTTLMFVAIFLGLTPAVLSLHHIIITKKDAMPERTAYNTIVFCLAAIPAAISQLYKEHTLTRLRQPIDRNALNGVLSVFQLLFAIVVSPLAYGLQGMGEGPRWTGLYPSKSIGENFSHGMACFLGTIDEETMRDGYPESARCEWAWALSLLHVISIIFVGHAIDKLAAATKVMYRGVSMGIMIAVLLMFVYQIRDQWCEYGPLVSFFHLTSTAVLIIGAEIYHRVSLVDASFETVYPELGDLYDEEE